MRRRFTVEVPFEPIVHESLESSVHCTLTAGTVNDMEIAVSQEGYVATLVGVASNPTTAMLAAVGRVEDLLRLLAATGDAFRVRAGGVKVVATEPVAESPPPRTANDSVVAEDHLFLTSHLGVVKGKGSLEWEAAQLDRLNAKPGYVLNALELNYLAVSSDRPTTRFLLSVITLETLADGRLGPIPKLLGGRQDKPSLGDGLRGVLLAHGLGAEAADRVVGRALATEEHSRIDHIARYLTEIEVKGWDASDVRDWWKRRGGTAHGSTHSVDQASLSKLRTTTLEAIRHEVGLS